MEEAKRFYEEQYAAKYAQPPKLCLCGLSELSIGYIKVDMKSITILATGFARSSGIKVVTGSG